VDGGVYRESTKKRRTAEAARRLHEIYVRQKSTRRENPPDGGRVWYRRSSVLCADDVARLKAFGAFEQIELHGLTLVERTVAVLLNGEKCMKTSSPVERWTADFMAVHAAKNASVWRPVNQTLRIGFRARIPP
jgi:hypothetical protein